MGLFGNPLQATISRRSFPLRRRRRIPSGHATSMRELTPQKEGLLRILQDIAPRCSNLPSEVMDPSKNLHRTDRGVSLKRQDPIPAM